jgi:tRNA pseudouridine38-40 synthase
MVRMLVGTMVDIGLGRRPVGDMTRLVESADNADTSPPAPPEGLYFVSALYPPSAFAAPIEERHAALQTG